jgi:hypothetical protein
MHRGHCLALEVQRQRHMLSHRFSESVVSEGSIAATIVLTSAVQMSFKILLDGP